LEPKKKHIPASQNCSLHPHHSRLPIHAIACGTGVCLFYTLIWAKLYIWVLRSCNLPTLQITNWARTCRWCCGLYPGGMLHSLGLYLPISWVHKQGGYAAWI
jgi:hypothetical protein